MRSDATAALHPVFSYGVTLIAVVLVAGAVLAALAFVNRNR